MPKPEPKGVFARLADELLAYNPGARPQAPSPILDRLAALEDASPMRGSDAVARLQCVAEGLLGVVQNTTRIATVLERAAGVQEFALLRQSGAQVTALARLDWHDIDPCRRCGCRLSFESMGCAWLCAGCGADRSEDPALDQGWISVADRPPVNDLVMVLREPRSDGKPWYDLAAWSGSAWCNGASQRVDVTHWRPLPAPPAETAASPPRSHEDAPEAADPTPDPSGGAGAQDGAERCPDCSIKRGTRSCKGPGVCPLWDDVPMAPRPTAESLPPMWAPLPGDGLGLPVTPPQDGAEPDWRVLMPQRVEGPGLVAFEVRSRALFTTTDPRGAGWQCSCGERFDVRVTWTPEQRERLSPSYEAGPGSPIRVTSTRRPRVGDRVRASKGYGEGVVMWVTDGADGADGGWCYRVRLDSRPSGCTGGELSFSANELTVIEVPGAPESPPEPAAPPDGPQPTPAAETATAPSLEPAPPESAPPSCPSWLAALLDRLIAEPEGVESWAATRRAAAQAWAAAGSPGLVDVRLAQIFDILRPALGVDPPAELIVQHLRELRNGSEET